VLYGGVCLLLHCTVLGMLLSALLMRNWCQMAAGRSFDARGHDATGDSPVVRHMLKHAGTWIRDAHAHLKSSQAFCSASGVASGLLFGIVP
jgi:hypothetical protein